MTVYKNQEQKLRRALNKCGYSLHKSRRGIGLDNLGGYMVVDQYANVVVAGLHRLTRAHSPLSCAMDK